MQHRNEAGVVGIERRSVGFAGNAARPRELVYSCKQYRRQMRGGRVLEIRGGNHYIFVSHRDQTLRAMRDFLRGVAGATTRP